MPAWDDARPVDPHVDGGDLADLVLALIGSRHSVSPKRLRSPGPDAAQLQQVIEAAACAPDHRGLRPWRLIRIADHQRDALADLFEACLHDRSDGRAPLPTHDDVAKSRDKAHRAPTLFRHRGRCHAPWPGWRGRLPE